MGKSWEPEGPEDIAEILDTVSTRIPMLIRNVMDSFFSPEAAGNIAKSVAEFRKTLIEGGIPEEEAMRMTREYLQTLTNWKGMMGEHDWGHHKRREE
jgi:hypothetical protein